MIKTQKKQKGLSLSKKTILRLETSVPNGFYTMEMTLDDHTTNPTGGTSTRTVPTCNKKQLP